MPSPFPGMDPYLEHPDFWPGTHHLLISLLTEALVPQIRPKYEVAIEQRIYTINDANEENGKSLCVGIPDVGIQRQPNSPNIPTGSLATATLTTPTTVTIPMPRKIKQAYLEVREMVNKEVVAAIEILSPVNKRNGEGRETYLKKRARVLGSLTHLIEIDLLRGWEAMPILNNPIQSHYRVLVSRSDRRPRAELYAVNLDDTLPVFPLPLREEDVEPQINLQQLLGEVYDRAGYDYRINYKLDPMPALSEAEASWAKEQLRSLNL
ncbi:MAG: DUF4058 family protein [Cyanobacteriota bacterium]|nr:DUF4058 family protein [Cyanobacteriota bacterium]